MDNSDILKEIILFEDERQIFFQKHLLTIDDYKDKYNMQHTLIRHHLDKFLSDKKYYLYVRVRDKILDIFTCNIRNINDFKDLNNYYFDAYISDYDYNSKMSGKKDWIFRMFREDFNLEKFKKVINLKKYVNNKFLDNFKKIKPDLFIKYH